MALCRNCRKPIPCHCHVTPAREIRPGIYLAAEQPAEEPNVRLTDGDPDGSAS